MKLTEKQVMKIHEIIERHSTDVVDYELATDDINAYLLAAPSEPQASEPPDEVAWLIERDGPQWLFVAGDMLEWSSDSLRALRFSRKQDAEAFLVINAGLYMHCGLKVTEHKWMKVQTDFHSVNLSTGEKTRSIVGDGERRDEVVGPAKPQASEPRTYKGD